MSTRLPSLRTIYLVLLAVSLPSTVSGQSPPGCEGQGASPPAWFSTPPEPPPAVYQAEARSGGCSTAEKAQKVAARVASWLLVREKSWQAVLEEVRVTRRQTDVGPGGDLQQQLQVVEHAVTRKILRRSWVHRQATRWTGDGRAEHFLVVRADTAALRSVAAEELQRYLSDRQTALAAGEARPSDDELRWTTLDSDPEAAADAGSTDGGSSRSRSTLSGLLGFKEGPPLKQFVLSWQAEPMADSLTLDRLPQEAQLGLRLIPPASGWYAALGGRYARGPDRQFGTDELAGTVALSDQQAFEAGVLAGAPRQLVPVYGGVRYRWYSTAAGGGRVRDREAALGYLGLGYPPFTELKETRIRNLWAQAGLVPHLTSLRAGGRVVLVTLPGTSVHTVFRFGTGVREVDSADNLALPWDDDRLFVSQVVASGGLELRWGGSVGVFALIRLDRSELTRASKLEAEEYAHLFRSFETVSQAETETGVRLGLRLAF